MLYDWVRAERRTPAVREADASHSAEMHRLQAELRRVIEERDFLKKAAAYFAKMCGDIGLFTIYNIHGSRIL